jgi:tetratricopeptide (TPR) repeat protein
MANRKYKWWEWPVALITAGAIVYFANVLAQKSHFGWIEQPEKFFTFVLSAFTFLLLVAAVLVYRDRRALQEEYDRYKKDLEERFRKDLDEMLKTRAADLDTKITDIEAWVQRAKDDIERECQELKVHRTEKEKEFEKETEEAKKRVSDSAEKAQAVIAEKMALPILTAPQAEIDAVKAYNDGIDLYKAGKIEDANFKYREAIRLNPNFAEAHYNLGVALGKKGRTDEAAKKYREAIRSRPDYALAHYNLACCYALQGKKEEALQSLAQAVDYAYEDWPLMEKDEDLNSIRGDARFEALAEKVKARWEEKQKKKGKGQ